MNEAMPPLSIYVFLVRTEKTLPFLLFLKNLSTHPRLGLPSGFFPHIFPRVCINFLFRVPALFDYSNKM